MNLDAADFAARPGVEAAFEARVSADTDSSSTTRVSMSSGTSEGKWSAAAATLLQQTGVARSHRLAMPKLTARSTAVSVVSCVASM